MRRNRSFLHTVTLLFIGAIGFNPVALAADGVIREADAKLVLADMNKASEAHDWDRWGQHLAADCPVVIHTEAGGAGPRTLRFSKSQYLALARRMDSISKNDATYSNKTSPPKIRLETGARQAVATMTTTEHGTGADGKPFAVVSTTTTQLEYRGEQLQVVTLDVVERSQTN